MPDPFDFANEDVFPQSDRLQILSPEEYELLWGLPRFSQADRELFFTLNQREEQTLGRLRTPRTKLHFLLQIGYFRARQRIFRLDVETVRDDLAYVSRRYLDGVLIADLNISKHTRQQHLSLILALFGYRMIDQRIRLTLEERALVAARISSRPVYVLRDLIDHLRHQRVVLPGYTHLQDVVRRALSFERQRLSEALDQFITPDDEVMLDALLSDDDGLHAVTSIKHHPRDFSHKQLLVEIERGHQIRELFFVARRVIAQAGLSAESVRFYASLVQRSATHRYCGYGVPTGRNWRQSLVEYCMITPFYYCTFSAVWAKITIYCRSLRRSKGTDPNENIYQSRYVFRESIEIGGHFSP